MAKVMYAQGNTKISTSTHGFRYFVGSDSTAQRFIDISNESSNTNPPDTGASADTKDGGRQKSD